MDRRIGETPLLARARACGCASGASSRQEGPCACVPGATGRGGQRSGDEDELVYKLVQGTELRPESVLAQKPAAACESGKYATAELLLQSAGQPHEEKAMTCRMQSHERLWAEAFGANSFAHEQQDVELRDESHENLHSVKNRALSGSCTKNGLLFAKIAQGEKILPQHIGHQGFMTKNERVLGFRGIAEHDLAIIWHMLLIPTGELGQGMELGDIRLRWVFDLRKRDIPLLKAMREQGKEFVRANYDYFAEKWAGQEIQGHDIGYWLQPENLQFGFHTDPTVGYLHCHLLVGPVTEFGYIPQYQNSWFPLDEVLRILEERNPSIVELRDESTTHAPSEARRPKGERKDVKQNPKPAAAVIDFAAAVRDFAVVLVDSRPECLVLSMSRLASLLSCAPPQWNANARCADSRYACKEAFKFSGLTLREHNESRFDSFRVEFEEPVLCTEVSFS